MGSAGVYMVQAGAAYMSEIVQTAARLPRQVDASPEGNVQARTRPWGYWLMVRWSYVTRSHYLEWRRSERDTGARYAH
jgi:hypothetical protein